MNSRSWHDSAAFERHRTNRDEIAGLLAHADRCLSDGAATVISAETRHAALHNAVIYLAKAALAASGCRTTESHHYWSIESLRHTVGLPEATIALLHAHRRKRHQSSYEYDGVVSNAEAMELLATAQALRATVHEWLSAHHPELS